MRLIDADALVKELSDKYIVPVDEATRGVAAFMGIQTRQAIENAPTIEAVPEEQYQRMVYTVASLTEKVGELMDAEPIKHGRWIYEQLPLPLSDGSKECVRCSVCGTHWDNESNYCPYCGARMDGEEND